MSRNAKRFVGRVAFVTGGSLSIGAAIVKRLALEGARVTFTYPRGNEAAEEAARFQAELQAELGEVGLFVRAVAADSLEPDVLASAIRETAALEGRLDILVNNAGVGKLSPVQDIADEDYERALAINVTAVVVATREAARLMTEGGRIISIGSANSEMVPYQGASIYALTKGAVVSFMQAVARDLGPEGITANTVLPGPIDTRMNPADGPRAGDNRRRTALERFGHVDEVANLVAFLASDEGSYITGARMTVDGGYTS